MADILVLALPEDRAEAATITDALLADGLDAQLITAAPEAGDWVERTHEVAAAKCAVFCWSAAATAETALPFRELAAGSAAAGRALAVRFDRSVEVPQDPPVTVYDIVRGWRLRPNWWQSIVSGNYFVKEVVVAARSKRAGLDPPPPSALQRMVRRRAVAVVLVVGSAMATLSGIAQFFDSAPWPRVCEARALRAVEPGRCDQLKRFADRYPEGRYGRLAATSLANPRPTIVKVRKDRVAAVSGPLALGPGEATEAAARESARRWGDADLARQCDGYARNVGGEVAEAVLERPDFVCQEAQGRHLCLIEAAGRCSISEPVEAPSCTIVAGSPPLATRMLDPLWPSCD